MAMWSGAQAAPGNALTHQAAQSDDTPTETLLPTLTDTPTDTVAITDTPTASLTPVFTSTPSITPSRTLTASVTLTPTLTKSPTVTPSLTKSPTYTLTPTNTGTPPTPTPSAPNHIVISEFRTLGPAGANDEFVELYNPTGAAVNIGGWQIDKSSACGTTVQTLVTIPSGTILNPGQHYLAAFTDNSLPTNVPPDQTFSLNISDTGGLALVESNLIVDQVGMCDGTYFHEENILQPLPVAAVTGTPTPLPGTSDQSYERKPGGNTACYDTNNNANDFALISPANPQDMDSQAVMCAGVILSSPTITPTITPSRTPTPTTVPTAIPGAVVINEFLPHPHSDWNGDGVADDGDEYIEIINASPSALNVKGWKLDTGLGSIKTFSLPDLTLQPRQIAAFFGIQTGISLSDGGGTVRLLKTDGHIVDAYTYPLVEVADQTWCRFPDGGGVWGFACHPSPGRPNIFLNSTPGSGAVAGSTSICTQVNTPASIILAECDSFGAGIINSPGEKLIWLQSRWKWDVFVK